MSFEGGAHSAALFKPLQPVHHKQQHLSMGFGAMLSAVQHFWQEQTSRVQLQAVARRVGKEVCSGQRWCCLVDP